MDDAGARHANQLRAVMQQAVEQRAGPVARTRVHDEARRLVDDHDVVVFVHDGEIHRFRRERRVFRRSLWHDDNGFIAIGRVLAPGRFTVNRDVAAFEPLLQAAARELGHEAGHYLVEALAAVFLLQRQGNGRQIGAWQRDEPDLQFIVKIRVNR